MSENTIIIRVDPTMVAVLEDIRKNAIDKICRIFNISEVQVNGALASKILAASYWKEHKINIKIKKVGKNFAVVET